MKMSGPLKRIGHQEIYSKHFKMIGVLSVQASAISQVALIFVSTAVTWILPLLPLCEPLGHIENGRCCVSDKLAACPPQGVDVGGRSTRTVR